MVSKKCAENDNSIAVCENQAAREQRAAFSYSLTGLSGNGHNGDWDMPRSILVTLWSLGAACLFAFGIATAIMVH
jgi:hypothetical protein